MRIASALKKASLLGLVASVAYVASYAPPAGVPDAEGCSGAWSSFGGAAQWEGLSIKGAATGAVEIGSDGFFVIDLDVGEAGELESLVSEVVVEVKTGDGVLVPGRVIPVSYSPTVYSAGWLADEELEVGALLDVSMSVTSDPSISAFATLEVTGPRTPLSTGTLTFDQWRDWRHGVGEMIECETETEDDGSCGAGGGWVHAREERLLAVDATWTAPAVRGFVYWEARVDLLDRDGDALGTDSYDVVVVETVARPRNMGPTVFPSDATEHCVRLTVTDLLTSEELSTELCGEPRSPVIYADDDLGWCSRPPKNGARTETWCQLNPASALAACGGVPLVPGIEGLPGSGPGTGRGGSGSVAKPSGADEEGTPDDSPRLAQSCQLAPAPSRSGGVLALLLVAVLGRRVRRRR